MPVENDDLAALFAGELVQAAAQLQFLGDEQILVESANRPEGCCFDEDERTRKQTPPPA